jgi:hypothetical protein
MTQPRNIFRTMILPASVAPMAREIASMAGGGDAWWTTPLSASGKDPATHFISTGHIPTQMAQMLPLQTWGQDASGVWIKTASTPGNATAVHGFLQQRGVTTYTLAQITAMMAAADITEQPPFTAMARLNLTIINLLHET